MTTERTPTTACAECAMYAGSDEAPPPHDHPQTPRTPGSMTDAMWRARNLPDRIVVGANGAYWRDYGDHYSMCPVSEDNDPVEVVAVYVRAEVRASLDVRMLAAWRETKDFLCDRLVTSGRSDVNINAVLRVMNSAFDDVARAEVPTEGLDVVTWRCPSCRNTVAPMGMCQTCGIFGLRYEVSGMTAPVDAWKDVTR